MILLLNTLVEGLIGLLFLFYPGAPELVPGFADGSGPSYGLLMKMYGWAALFVAGLSLAGYLQRGVRPVVMNVTGMLTGFHLGLAVILTVYHPDSRAMLLHFLLGIFMAGRFLQTRRLHGRVPDQPTQT